MRPARSLPVGTATCPLPPSRHSVFETLVYQPNARTTISHNLTFRISPRHRNIRNIDSYTGVKGSLTPRLALTVGLTWNYDGLLALAETPVAANAFRPGSPAITVFATEKTYRQLTARLQFTF